VVFVTPNRNELKKFYGRVKWKICQAKMCDIAVCHSFTDMGGSGRRTRVS